jgi:hypothetical protein
MVNAMDQELDACLKFADREKVKDIAMEAIFEECPEYESGDRHCEGRGDARGAGYPGMERIKCDGDIDEQYRNG